jgi:hypothetical protein
VVLFADALQEIHPRERRHAQVKKEQIEGVSPDTIQSLGAVMHGFREIPIASQPRHQDTAQVLLIICHQNPHRVTHPSLFPFLAHAPGRASRWVCTPSPRVLRERARILPAYKSEIARLVPSLWGLEIDALPHGGYNGATMNSKPYLGESWREGVRRVLWIAGMALLLGAVFFGSELIRLYTDWLWFLDVGYRDVFVKTTVIKIGLMVAAALLFFTLIYANLLAAQRLTPRPALYLDDQRQFRVTLTQFGRQGLSIILLIVAVAVSLTVGLAAAKGWYDYLFFRNPVPFNQADPIFNRDISFYVFQLPFLRFVYRWLMVGWASASSPSRRSTGLIGEWISSTVRRGSPRTRASTSRRCWRRSSSPRPGATGWHAMNCCSLPTGFSSALASWMCISAW